MSNIFKGLCWAGAILLNALGNYLGLIDDKTAQTMFIILPAMFVISLNGARSCWPHRKEA